MLSFLSPFSTFFRASRTRAEREVRKIHPTQGLAQSNVVKAAMLSKPVRHSAQSSVKLNDAISPRRPTSLTTANT